MNTDNPMPNSGGGPEPAPTPAASEKPRGNLRTTLLRVVLYGGILGLLTAIAIPNFVKARRTECKSSCIANLKQIDGAIQQWALENKKSATDAPDLAALLPYLKGGVLPTCPGGGTYGLGKTVGDSPVCLGNKDNISHALK